MTNRNTILQVGEEDMIMSGLNEKGQVREMVNFIFNNLGIFLEPFECIWDGTVLGACSKE